MAFNNVGSLTVSLLGNTASASKGLDKMTTKIAAFGNKVAAVGVKVASAGKAMSVAITLPLLALGTASVIAFDKQAKALAQVEQAIISTGGAAGYTVDQLAKIASGLQEITVFGDEEILSGVTAQLLTFSNLVGPQFEAAQVTVMDLATRLGTDLKSAAIQVGKALNDPITGLSMLSRSGITFTDSQKEVITSLWKTGKQAEAQNVILKELNRQYGGSAKAAVAGAGKLKQLKNAIGDVSEQFGALIVAGMDPFIDKMKALTASIAAMSTEQKEKLLKYLAVFAVAGPAFVAAGTIAKLVPALISLWGAISASPIGMMLATVAAAKLLGDHFVELYDLISDKMGDLFKGEQETMHVTQKIIDMFVKDMDDAGNAIIDNVNYVGGGMQDMINDLQAARDAATAALTSGEMAFGEASRKFQNDANTILDNYGVMDDYTRSLFGSMVDMAIASWAEITGVTIDATGTIVTEVEKVGEATDDTGEHVENLAKVFRTFELDAAIAQFKKLSDQLADTKEGSLDYIVIVGKLQKAYAALIAAEAAVSEQDKDVGAGLEDLIAQYDALAKKLGLVLKAAEDLGDSDESIRGNVAAWTKLADAVGKGADAVKEKLDNVMDAVSNSLSTFFDAVSEMKATNEEALKDYKKSLQDLADAEGKSDKEAADRRQNALRSLSNDLEDDKITREKYGREKAQIEADYSKAVDDAATARKNAGDSELAAYHDQQVGIEDILGDMLHSFLKAAREQLTLEAAKEAVLAAAMAFTLNPAAIGHALAAAEYLAGAATLAVAGFEKGGTVPGPPGEPIIIEAHGGETITPVGGVPAGIDYQMIGRAVAAGTYDAMKEVLGKDSGRPIIVQVGESELARVMYPALLREGQRLGVTA